MSNAAWRRILLHPSRFDAMVARLPESKCSAALVISMMKQVEFVKDPLVPENRGFAIDGSGNIVAVFKFGDDMTPRERWKKAQHERRYNAWIQRMLDSEVECEDSGVKRFMALSGVVTANELVAAIDGCVRRSDTEN